MFGRICEIEPLLTIYGTHMQAIGYRAVEGGGGEQAPHILY